MQAIASGEFTKVTQVLAVDVAAGTVRDATAEDHGRRQGTRRRLAEPSVRQDRSDFAGRVVLDQIVRPLRHHVDRGLDRERPRSRKLRLIPFTTRS